MTQTTSYTVAAVSRAITGKQVKTLRSEGMLPAVVYGHNKKTTSISVPAKSFISTFRESGTSSLIDLSVDGATSHKVLVHDIQVHPTTRIPLHVDFYLVNMKEKLQTEIALEFIGVAPIVDAEGGTLITVKSELQVECLPQDLVPHFEVDISTLQSFDDVIRVKDVVVPTNITILDEPDDVVLSVTEPRSEEEIAALDEAVSEDATKVESETGNEPAPVEQPQE
jgi:large subunit ribosomal protein L25